MKIVEELAKAYNPREVEDKIYELWEKSGFFTPETTRKQGLKGLTQKKFVVTIAPPNITGELHMGHALENILVDIIVRMKRMAGYEVLWVPGLDHAGIATQNIVEKELAKKGLTRHDLGKEKFLELIWQWKEKSGSRILEQLKKLGLSLDWSRTRFTMDEDYKKAVYEAFAHYKMKDWIYQGSRVINFCPRCQSAISDLEVEYREEKGKLYFIKYPLVGQKDYIVVATTRPETMLGDAAVAVSPNDDRYKKLIGKKALLPIQEREIPIIADEAVDINFGTGAVKVTPAHSISDFEISQRHELKTFEVIDKDAKMTKDAGPLCEGLSTLECREKVVEKLQELGLLEKIEEIQHSVGRCERCETIIEPLFSKQWFLKMDELAKHAVQALEKGWVKFHPQSWEGPYLNWLKNIRDWNISRQIWWGHPLPTAIPQPASGGAEPSTRGSEEDVLDTWFSSALWPFAVMFWPNINHPDYKNYYPTQFISSARDILHLWITRMIFSGIELTGEPPFSDIYIHPTVLTKEGQRMSKSLGTGVDPLDLTEKYGTDALRFGLAFQTTGIQDMRFNEEVIDTGRKFANKIWNVARFILMHIGPSSEALAKEDELYDLKLPSELDKIDKEFASEFKKLAESTSESIENFSFGKAANDLYHFFWDHFAAVYIEDSKEKITADQTGAENKKQTLLWLLAGQLKLLHPFMPFITEEIWGKLPLKDKKLLLVEEWPT